MLEVDGLTKYYGDLLAVDNMSFRIEQGEFATLLGPSGCGKSTTLHAIAGLIEPSDGTVKLRGKDVTHASPDERNIGLVFQHSALFPHMSVEKNLRYGLRMQGVDESVHDERIEKYLSLIQMSEYGPHKPDELSGGQQRRISLARALVYEPDILLLDEPLTGLDRVLREDMRNEIRTIQREVDVTTLHVTHDQEEALSMSDKVMVMNEGHKEQEGPPMELYQSPATKFVADFVGKSTRFDGEVVDTSPPTLDTDRGTIYAGNGTSVERGQTVSAYVRPEAIEVSSAGQNGAENTFQGTVRHIEYLGNRNELEVELPDGHVVTVNADPDNWHEVDEQVSVGFDAEDVILL